MLLTSYFQHFILPYFYMIKYNMGLALVSCQWCNIRYPLGFKMAISFGRKSQFTSIGLYAEGSCTYQFVLFVKFYFIRYGDIAVQSVCTVSCSIRANDLGTHLPYIECIIHWHKLSGKPCTHFAKLHLRNG